MRVKTLVTKRMKGGSSSTQGKKRRSGKGKKDKSPQLPAPKTGKTRQTVPPNQACAWKKSNLKEEDIQALVEAGLLQEKSLAGWSSAHGDAWPFEKNPDEVPMFARFAERGLALPAYGFFCGLLDYYKIERVHLNPYGVFHTSLFVHFCEAFMGIHPHWALFRKLFRVKPHPDLKNPQLVCGAGIQMREKVSELYFDYQLTEHNQDWKYKWFYIYNLPSHLPKPSTYAPVHHAL